MEQKERQPAAPLDEEPVLYRGLGMTALIRTLVASCLLWILPAAIVSMIALDGHAATMLFISVLIIATVLTTAAAAQFVRRLRRGRPKNWFNRELASRLKSARMELVTQRHWSR